LAIFNIIDRLGNFQRNNKRKKTEREKNIIVENERKRKMKNWLWHQKYPKDIYELSHT
jgi:hypothetical protein